MRVATELITPRLRPVTFATRLGRGAIGFGLGWVWCSAGSLLWLAALALGYGGLDEGLSRFKDEWWSPIAMAAYFGSVAGSWAGGAVGPAAVGPTRRRHPILTSSLLGGAAGGTLAAAVGAAVGWLVWRDEPRSSHVFELPMYVGAVLGVLAGLCAGRSISRAGSSAAFEPICDIDSGIA